MKNLSQQIKQTLISLASNDKLPLDLNELDASAFDHLSATRKSFPNGFTSWYETHHEVVSELTLLESQGVEIQARTEWGTGGMYELAQSITDEFEELNEDREWDGEFFDEIEEFVKSRVGC